MTPEPVELINLRARVKASYAVRIVEYPGEYKNGKRTTKHRVWRADPKLVEQLEAAEIEWRRELMRRRGA